MAGRRIGRRKGFAQLYDQLRDVYGCPVEALFVIACNDHEETQHRVNAASKLLRHRYPIRKELEVTPSDELTDLLEGVQQRRELAHQEGRTLPAVIEGTLVEPEDREVDERDPLLG